MLVVISAFMVFLFCLWYWQTYHHADVITTADYWQQVTTPLIGIDQAASKQQIDAAQLFADTNNNNYGALTSLVLAQHFVKNHLFFAAEKQLQKALKQTSEMNLQSLIKLKLARVQLQQKNIDGALKTINTIKQHGWLALALELNGDAQMLKGDYHAARKAYEKALQLNVRQTIVRIKLKELLR